MLTDGKAVIGVLGAVLFLTMIVFDLTMWNVLYSLILFGYIFRIRCLRYFCIFFNLLF